MQEKYFEKTSFMGAIVLQINWEDFFFFKTITFKSVWIQKLGSQKF